jgi:hypothetical protein
MLHKTLLRLILTYGTECWTRLKRDGNMFRIFERRILGMIYRPFRDNGIWRIACSNEIYALYDE